MHADTPSSFPLTRAQRGLWIGSKLQVDKMLMLSEALELFGPLDPTLLMQANRQITREFDTLRLCIREHDGLPEQVVLPEYPGELQYLDFSDEPAPRAAAERWVGDQLGKRENLHDGPLWFCVVFRLGQDHHLWVQYTSHLVMDGFTGTMLAQRLASLYNAYVSGQEPEPAAYGSVLELVTLEQEYRASDRYRRDREYWMQHLSNVPPAVTLAKPGEQHSAGLLRATGEFCFIQSIDASAHVRSWRAVRCSCTFRSTREARHACGHSIIISLDPCATGVVDWQQVAGRQDVDAVRGIGIIRTLGSDPANASKPADHAGVRYAAVMYP